MNWRKIEEKYNEYCNLLNFYKKELHYADDLSIEDDEYDDLKRKIEEIETNYPQIASKDSPLNVIGSEVSTDLKSVKHEIKMESLHDSFTFEEIRKFYDKSNSLSYAVEPKIDGLSISVIYENGILKTASTRGNGYYGEDITEKAKKIKNLPHEIDKGIPLLEVRGEVFMPRVEFKGLIKKYEEFDGSQPFKNPRNAAAGILRNKNLKIVESYNLKVLIFNVERLITDCFYFRAPWNLKDSNFLFNTHANSLEYAKKLGLPVINSFLCESYEDIEDKIEEIKKRRLSFEFQVDGAVIKINELPRRAQLGSTNTHPRWAEAYKYKPEEAITKILNIENQLGRSGALTPVATFDSVMLSGSYISKATLHNYDYIVSKDIKIGDYVRIRKAGDIVPEVISHVTEIKQNDEVVDLKEYHHNLPTFNPPEFCPFCNSKLEKKPDEIALKCQNDKCKKKIIEKIAHFTSKNAMDIEILGRKTVEKLVNSGILNSFEDIYKLDAEVIYKEDIESINKINSGQIKFDDFDYDIYLKKDIKKIMDKIEESKGRPLSRVIYALGIPYVGRETSLMLANKFKEFKKLTEVKEDDLNNIEGIGEISIKSILNFFKKEKFKYFEEINFRQ
ncbi:MAG: NAD-dependent DNA ligase LigA [Candidatus Improbicoccus pseudotrichonymphae]|uniref:DNA ligase n=1 Tax=Candidatus Improbicoccus pseudotrichonymphae TaxID=3033792 RepID=A0AA48IH18_9FIRM|nr:MAG: NAD-dependent DNA ligase LigA [Candidatus Improbicoccus pseudotrichonymphae]